MNLTLTGKKMKKVSNKTVEELVRLIPVLSENIDLTGKGTKVINAVRLSKNIVKQLKKIK